MWVNRTKWFNQLLRLLGWMLMFNMILSACSVVGVRAWEEPAYQTKLQDGKFEIREYQTYLVAEVYMEGEDFEQASGMGFEFWLTTSSATISRVLQVFKWLEKQRKRAKTSL